MDASDHPTNRRRRVLDRLAAAHGAGDRTAYDEARADLVKVNVYAAEYLGIPRQYVDPVTGRFEDRLPAAGRGVLLDIGQEHRAHRERFEPVSRDTRLSAIQLAHQREAGSRII